MWSFRQGLCVFVPWKCVLTCMCWVHSLIIHTIRLMKAALSCRVRGKKFYSLSCLVPNVHIDWYLECLMLKLTLLDHQGSFLKILGDAKTQLNFFLSIACHVPCGVWVFLVFTVAFWNCGCIDQIFLFIFSVLWKK